MNEFFLCVTEKVLEMFVEKALSLFAEYLITELIKESINQAQRRRQTQDLKRIKRI
ncbi:MAG: hypothetical protein N2235_13020 [Fischerella sp.]|nr:hypothetical protein [Fischerella sp.]